MAIIYVYVEMQEEQLYIPLFPLDIFLLPGEQMPLHIFEPRYRQLLEEVEELGLEFGLPFGHEAPNLGYVSVCRLLKVTKRYESGESDVIIEALRIAELKGFEPAFSGKLYPGGFVKEWKNEVLNRKPSAALVEVFIEYIKLKYGTQPLSSNIQTYRLIDLAASIALSSSDKIKLIQLDSADRQSQFLTKSIHYLNLLLAQEKSYENGFILN
ncbi:MAG: LON peptidase substrate-binding domain-containing protein [Cryomorphaceae bacterium]